MDLKDRLVDLADELTDVRPPVGLWDREVRRRRRARRDTVAVILVAVLAVAGVLTGTWQASRQVTPASPTGKTFLPDQLFTPSKWLPGTDEGGELGPVIAVRPADRGSWWGTRPGVVGLSGATGEYRYLDLPHLVDPIVNGLALSPDGRLVAYWMTGPTGSTPHERSGSVAGVAVYDTVSGQVRRAMIPTEHGLSPSTLTFLDQGTLVIDFGQWRAGFDASPDERASAAIANTLVWHLAESGPTTADFPRWLSPQNWPATRNGRVWSSWWVEKGSVLFTLGDSPRYRRMPAPVVWGGRDGRTPEGALSTDGRWLAIVRSGEKHGRTPNRVGIYDLNAQPSADCCGHGHVLPGKKVTLAVLAWTGPHEILTWRRVSLQGKDSDRKALFKVDTRTGDSTEVVRLPSEDSGGWIYAVDLLGSPIAPGVEPPQPWDPRLVVGGISGIVVASGLALWLLGRRRG